MGNPLRQHTTARTHSRLARFDKHLLFQATAAVVYAAHTADIRRPIVLEHDGQPVAAIVPYRDYRRFLTWKEQDQQAAWREMEELLAHVHSQPTKLTPEEIEAQVTSDREEVRGLHRARRSSLGRLAMSTA